MYDKRDRISPPHQVQTTIQSLKCAGIWTALSETYRRQILNILMRMVMQRLAAPPAEKEVRHDQ